MRFHLGYGGGVIVFVILALVYGLVLEELADAALPAIPRYIIREAKGWYDESVKHKSTYGLSERVFIAYDSLKRLFHRMHPETCDFCTSWNVMPSPPPGKTLATSRYTIAVRTNYYGISISR